MRYGIVSDIHGNLEALEAVEDSLRGENIDKCLCLGDIVGYGADPGACLELMRSLDPAALVAGNHEWGVLGLRDLDDFTELAQAAIRWTKNILGKAEVDYLKSFSLIHDAGPFTLVHGSLENPGEFNYIYNSEDAYRCMRLMSKDICFVGHTHRAGIFFMKSGTVEYSTDKEMRLEPGVKYLINTGSVGQPRDLNWRSSYIVYDEEGASIKIVRVPYDVSKAKAKILSAGLPEILAERLSVGR